MAPQLLRRRRKHEFVRPVTASARPVKVGDRGEADRVKKLRQGWQEEALAYADAIGELRYPLHFMANQTTRVRIYPAFLVDSDAPPVPLTEAQDVEGVTISDQLITAVSADLGRLGTGQIGMRPIMRGLYLNSKTTGEMYLVGYQPDDPDQPDEIWEIRGLDEVVFEDNGNVWLRDSPDQTMNAVDGMVLLPEDAYLERIWTPHLKWRALADSPMKPLLDSCEELLLASRAVRAALRSRLAGNGLGLIAQELTLPGIDDSDDDPESDPLLEEVARAMLTPIQDEASAAAVIPILMRAPADLIEKAAKFITFDRPIDATLPSLRAELIGRIATGMDWPKELVTGIADMNHWSSWFVDESTFKGHVEPDVITQCDSLTVGYARPMLRARTDLNIDPAVINRIVYWYDPTELVTKPDLSDNATTAVNAGAAGRASLRKYLGLTDDDKPDQLDEVLYTLQHLRGVDPAIAIPILAQVAPDMNWPDPAVLDGTIDGSAPGQDLIPTQGEAPPSHEPGAPVQPDEHPAVGADEQPPARAASAATDDSAQPAASSGAMVAFYPTADQAATLAIDGYEPAEQIHVTLAYLGNAADLTPEQLAALDSVCMTIAGQYPPLEGQFGGIGRFTADGNPEGDPVIATVDVPGLASLRDQLCQHLNAAGVPMPSEHGFTPHATLAYVPADEEMPAHRLDPVPASFGALSVCLGGDRQDYELTGQAEPLVAASNQGRKTDTVLALRLLDIDRQLRAKLLTACDAAVRRVLERAGAKLRSKAAKDAPLRASLVDVPNALVAARVGPERVTALGETPDGLTQSDWAELQRQWDKWVARAQRQARQAAARMADVDPTDPTIIDLAATHDQARNTGWQILSSGLSALVKARLFNPHPDAPPAGEFDPDLTVPPGLVRQAMATAGGGAELTIDGQTLPEGAWGVGQGSAVQRFLATNGMTRKSYTWQHGDSDRPLEAHEALDGYSFESWDDPGLANPDSFPEVDVLAPGDHDGCGCDAYITWESSAGDMPVAASGG